MYIYLVKLVEKLVACTSAYSRYNAYDEVFIDTINSMHLQNVTLSEALFRFRAVLATEQVENCSTDVRDVKQVARDRHI